MTTKVEGTAAFSEVLASVCEMIELQGKKHLEKVCQPNPSGPP